MALTATLSRLLRFLVSLVSRLRLSIGRIALALGTRFASLWRSLTFRRRRSHIRLHANDVPLLSSSPLTGNVQHNGSTTTERAPPIVQASKTSAHWQDVLPQYQTLVSAHKFAFEPAPTTPETGSQRYDSRTVNRNAKPPRIAPGQKGLLAALPSPPDKWRRYVHPEGNVIYYHEGLRVFTENDIFRHENDILVCATQLIKQAIDMKNDVELDESTELVVNVDKSRQCRYHFVDHTHRLIFWLVSRDVYDLGPPLEGIATHSHIRYMIEALYWYASGDYLGITDPLLKYIACDMESRSHCEYYPHNRTLPKTVFEDIRGMLNFAKTDLMTTSSSSSPFAQDELVAILDLVNSLKDDEKISDQYSIWVIARLMVFFTEIQVSNFFGQPCARLNADTPLFGRPRWNSHPVFIAVNLFFFGSANEHAVRLQRVWVDGIIIQPRWKDFISRLTSELGRYTIFSTVMLTVNFSFLAVPGVTTPGTRVTPIQIIIYCSIVSTVASIIFSFALLNVYSDPELLAAGSAAGAMRALSRTKAGLACLAVTHSLPIASLIWSIALFSAALAIQIFRPKDPATVATLGGECLVIVLFAIVSYWIIRPLAENDDDPADADVDDSAEGTPSPIGPSSNAV